MFLTGCVIIWHPIDVPFHKRAGCYETLSIIHVPAAFSTLNYAELSFKVTPTFSFISSKQKLNSELH